MKRMIIDHKKLTPSLAAMLLEKYPNGYGDEDLISFRSPRGEWVEAVELHTEDACYLVKISKRLSSLLASIEEFDEDLSTHSEGVSPDDLEAEFDGSLEEEFSLED